MAPYRQYPSDALAPQSSSATPSYAPVNYFARPESGLGNDADLRFRAASNVQRGNQPSSIDRPHPLYSARTAQVQAGEGEQSAGSSRRISNAASAIISPFSRNQSLIAGQTRSIIEQSRPLRGDVVDELRKLELFEERADFRREPLTLTSSSPSLDGMGTRLPLSSRLSVSNRVPPTGKEEATDILSNFTLDMEDPVDAFFFGAHRSPKHELNGLASTTASSRLPSVSSAQQLDQSPPKLLRQSSTVTIDPFSGEETDSDAQREEDFFTAELDPAASMEPSTAMFERREQAPAFVPSRAPKLNMLNKSKSQTAILTEMSDLTAQPYLSPPGLGRALVDGGGDAEDPYCDSPFNGRHPPVGRDSQKLNLAENGGAGAFNHLGSRPAAMPMPIEGSTSPSPGPSPGEGRGAPNPFLRAKSLSRLPPGLVSNTTEIVLPEIGLKQVPRRKPQLNTSFAAAEDDSDDRSMTEQFLAQEVAESVLFSSPFHIALSRSNTQKRLPISQHGGAAKEADSEYYGAYHSSDLDSFTRRDGGDPFGGDPRFFR